MYIIGYSILLILRILKGLILIKILLLYNLGAVLHLGLLVRKCRYLCVLLNIRIGLKNISLLWGLIVM